MSENSKNKECERCCYYGRVADAPETVEEECMYIPSEEEDYIPPCERRRCDMSDKVACKMNGTQRCEFDGTWLCKNPDCKKPVLTSTLFGARPSGCPLVDKWNSKSYQKGGGENE